MNLKIALLLSLLLQVVSLSFADDRSFVDKVDVSLSINKSSVLIEGENYDPPIEFVLTLKNISSSMIEFTRDQLNADYGGFTLSRNDQPAGFLPSGSPVLPGRDQILTLSPSALITLIIPLRSGSLLNFHREAGTYVAKWKFHPEAFCKFRIDAAGRITVAD